MQCKTCGTGHGLMLSKREIRVIGDGNMLDENVVAFIPSICDCCGGWWKDCENCASGERKIDWIEPDEYDVIMNTWMDDNFHTIVLSTLWLDIAQSTGVSGTEDFMNYLKRMIKKQTPAIKAQIEELIPGDAKKDVVVLARRTRLAMVQLHYNLGKIDEAEARQILNGRLSPDKPKTYFDDSDLLQVKENDNESQ